MLQKKNTYQIEWIYTVDFPNRVIPLVILQDGHPGYTINQWIYWLVEEGITPSLLDQHIRGVMHLYDFHYRTFGNKALNDSQAENLISDFLNAKRYGSELMEWEPNHSKKTVQRYLTSINLFDKWQSVFHGASRMNPSEERFISSWERYHDFQQRTKWDPMLHLFPSHTNKKVEHVHKLYIEHNRFVVGKKQIPKVFPIERFVDLIESTPNPRDKMLWLLMGGGSLRGSEPLHLYGTDILGVDNTGCARIRLDDPETGVISWDEESNSRTGTRAEYLNKCFSNEKFKYTVPELFNLKPRTLGKLGVDHAGFKGMTFSEGGENIISGDGRIHYWHEVFWCDPRFGSKFQQVYMEYMNEYFFDKPSDWPFHPYLFINVNKNNFGLPMKLGGIRKAWMSSLKRIGMGNCGLGRHSLRHMYGEYCASILNLPIEMTRTLMHHASVTSTEVYYHLRSKDVRNAINKAILENAGIKVLDYMILPGSKSIDVPESWCE